MGDQTSMITTEINDQGYHLVDSVTGERRSFTDRKEFARASLVEILKNAEEIDAGLAQLQRSYLRPRPVQALGSPAEAAKLLGGHRRDYEGMFRDPGPVVHVR
jgi:hypothetical protein